MTYSQSERGRTGGRPVELVSFVSGQSQWHLTTDVIEHAHLGVLYSPAEIRVGPIRQTEEADAGSVMVYLPRDHALADLLFSGLLFDPVAVRVFRRHRDMSPTAPTIFAQLTNPLLSPPTIAPFSGQVSQATIEEAELAVTCASVLALLETKIPQRVISRLCPHMQYGVACGLALADFVEEHEVTAISSDGLTLTVPTLFDLGFVDGATPDTSTLFTPGVVSFNGRYRMITQQTGTAIKLIAPMPGLVATDMIDIAPSCGRQVSRCHADFDNLHNFGGFPGMPERNPFDGRLV